VHRAVAAQAVKRMEAKEKAAKGRTPHRPGDEKDLPKTRRNAGQGYEELGRSFSEVRFSSHFYAISPARFPTRAANGLRERQPRSTMSYRFSEGLYPLGPQEAPPWLALSCLHKGLSGLTGSL